MAGEEPPYLTVGTDVSAKYKGAFCEAKIKKVTRSVKCKLTFKNNVGVAIVTDDQVRGTLRVGAQVEAKHPEKNQYLEAVINKLNDYSQYTVVFDDGDETTLRRTSLCLKSGRHFAEGETLDQLPLTHPEHFGNPVMNSKGRRSRTTTRSPAVGESSDDEQTPKKKEIKVKPSDPNIGKVVVVELQDKKKAKDNWFPALIVSPKCQDSIRIKKQEDYLVRSFRDGKYHVISKKESKEFDRDTNLKIENNSLKNAVDKVMTYLDKEDLPNHWDRDTLFGLEESSNEESDPASDSETSDDEPSEEKDRFVAQLYKFMDDRGTSINKAPTVNGRDLNLYKMFKLVQKAGGYNRATNQMQWKMIYAKMGFPPGNSAASHLIKQAYKKYLHGFEEFHRKLGISMGTSTRSSTRSGRYLLMSREQHFKGTRRKTKNDTKVAAVEKVIEVGAKSTEPDDSTDKDLNVIKTDKKLEETKPKTIKAKDVDSGEESHVEVNDSEVESTTTKEESKFKSKSDSKRNSKDEETLPKRRGRKKIEKAQNAEDDDSSNNIEDDEDDYRDNLNIAVGDRVKVKYGRGRQQKIYEAKVLKLGENENDKEFFVHYTGWNMRYDEWVKRHRIVKNLSQKGGLKRPRSTTPAKNVKAPAKKGRPQGNSASKKESVSDRKSNTPTNSRSRGSRGDKSNTESPVADQKRATRQSSLQRDISDESDSDSADNPKKTKPFKKGSNMDDDDSSPNSKIEFESEDALPSKDTEEVSKKLINKIAEKEITKKDAMEKSTRDKSDIRVQEEEEDKKLVKIITNRERQKSEEINEQLEESPKTSRRPRGRPPRLYEEKKTPSPTNDKRLLSSELEFKLELEFTDSESRDQSDLTNLGKIEQDDKVISDDEENDNEDKEGHINANVDEPEKNENAVEITEVSKNQRESPEIEPKLPEVIEEKATGTSDLNQSLNESLSANPFKEEESIKIDLICCEKALESEDSNIESPGEVGISSMDTSKENMNLKFNTDNKDYKENAISKSNQDVSTANEFEKKMFKETKTTVESLQHSKVETIPVAINDKTDGRQVEPSIQNEKLLEITKKEVLIEQTQCTLSNSSSLDIEPTNKSADLTDVYEYSEECFEEKINFKESVLKKIEKASFGECSQSASTSNSSTNENVEIEKDVENSANHSKQNISHDLSFLSDSAVAIQIDSKCEKREAKLESISGSSPEAHTMGHTSSKGTKKDKKKKNHKNEKRKLLENDTSEEGSCNEEPKAKKRRNKDDEISNRKEGKSKEAKQKKSRDKKNKSKSERDELKLLKKKGNLEKSRRRECKKKKESQEKFRKDKDDDLKVLDSDEISSVSSDSYQKKEKKRSKKHQHRCEKNREESEKKRLKKYKSLHDDGATSDESNRGLRKAKREEKSKNKKKRDKTKIIKDFPISSEDSNSSKTSVAVGKLKEKAEKNHKDEIECDVSKYLMCEEKVPASPVGIGDIPDASSSQEEKSEMCASNKMKENIRSKSSIVGGEATTSSFNLTSPHYRQLKLEMNNETTTLIDNTPPTTPDSSSTLVSEPLHNVDGSSNCMSPNDTDSNQLVITGKSSQSSSPNDYSDGNEHCGKLLIDEVDNRIEIATGSDEGERIENSSKVVAYTGASLKRPNSEHDEQISPRKRKKRHRKRSSSVTESSKQPLSTDLSNSKQNSSKHQKGNDGDDLQSSICETSLSTSGLLMNRLSPSGLSDQTILLQSTRPSRFNFYVELGKYQDGDQRIAILQEKLAAIRRQYMALKAEVACIDRRRKKIKKREKEAAAAATTAVVNTIVECN